MDEIYIDELTGCFNRRFLYYWVENEIGRSNRYTMKFALLLLDLDNFSDINNNFGHLEGDSVLIAFTEFIKENIREVDKLVRYGGDEFIILVPNAIGKGIHTLAQRLLSRLNKIEILKHKVRCSIGYAVFPYDGKTIETLFNQADNLMYQAKKQGKNRIGLKHKIIKKLQIPSPVTIGRKDETNWCLNQLQNCNTILVAGEVGVGKTRLTLEIKDRLSTGIFLRGNAYAALSSVPYHPFKNMFTELIEKHYALTQRAFKQIPDIYQSEVMKLFPAQGKLHADQTTDLDKYRLYNAVAEFIRKIAHIITPKETVLLLDDLHWMDRPSCEMLDFLIRSSNSNLKIFGTYRVEEIKTSQFSEFLGVWARERFYTQITVLPLNEKQTIQLLKAIVGIVPQYAAQFIHNESGGNPFFIEEIIRALEQQKKLYWGTRGWVFEKDLKVTIPTSVEETIKRKLTFLDPGIKTFLEIAAVFGQEFVADIIAMTSKRNVGEILQAFDELRRVGLISERTGENFFFSEDIVRQVVFKNIPRADLMRYHKLIGETIEDFYRGSLPNYFEQLATHFLNANEPRKALYYSKKAGIKAKGNYAHDLAIQFFESALKYETNGKEIFNIRFSLADICFWTGNYKRAIQELKACLKINPNAYKAYEQLGLVYANMGDYKNSLKYFRGGLKLTQKTDGEYKFRIHIARVYWRLAQLLRAKNECEDILKNIKDMKKPDIGLAYLTLGVVLMKLENLKKAELHLKKSLKIHRAIDDKNHIAACYQDLALCYLRKFNIKACENYLKKALDIDKKIGYLGGVVIARINLGALHSDYDIPKAEEYYLEALSAAKLIGAKRHIALLYNNLGHVYRYRLMDEQALDNFKKSLKLAKEIDYDEIIISSNLSLSETYREKGVLKKARTHLQTAHRLAEKLNLKSSMCACLMEELHYLLDSGSRKKLIAVSEKLNRAVKSESDLTFKIYGFIYRARVMVKLKKFSQAHAYYKRARNLLKSSSSNVTVGEIYYLEGLVYKQEKKLLQAKKMFKRAHDIFEAVGNLRYLDKVKKESAKISVK